MSLSDVTLKPGEGGPSPVKRAQLCDFADAYPSIAHRLCIIPPRISSGQVGKRARAEMMKITQVRNATLLIEYAGVRLLTDPMLSPKGTYPSFANTQNGHLRNPTVDLPLPISALIDVDAVIVTHTHLDHWDGEAKRCIPKDMPIFTQNDKDAETIRSQGFQDVRPLTATTHFQDIELIKTPGQHGSDYAIEKMGTRLGLVCGVVFQNPKEKTVYLAGDTIWNKYVEQSLKTYDPDIIILNCGDAKIEGVGSIIMGTHDLMEIHTFMPSATIICSHMEAVNHATLSRADLNIFIKENKMENYVLVPDDGACILI